MVYSLGPAKQHLKEDESIKWHGKSTIKGRVTAALKATEDLVHTEWTTATCRELLLLGALLRSLAVSGRRVEKPKDEPTLPLDEEKPKDEEKSKDDPGWNDDEQMPTLLVGWMRQQLPDPPDWLRETNGEVLDHLREAVSAAEEKVLAPLRLSHKADPRTASKPASS